MSVIWEQREGKVDEDGEPLEPAYVLRTEDGSHEQESGITDTEDVSYVSSPYLPQSLRGQGPPTTDNSNRAHESAAGESGIKDELDENIILRHVYVLVGEWIPFGANQIVALNEKLGSADRCQGGMFTGQVDKDSSSSNFQVDPGLTKVSILDFDDTKFINFEAEINFPEDEVSQSTLQPKRWHVGRLDRVASSSLQFRSALELRVPANPASHPALVSHGCA